MRGRKSVTLLWPTKENLLKLLFLIRHRRKLDSSLLQFIQAQIETVK
jgi:hypothetical protein